MKLNQLHATFNPKHVLLEYTTKLKSIMSGGVQLINEGKRVVVTTEIIDDEDDESKQAAKEARERFVEQAQKIGHFDNPDWVKALLNGLRQAGVHGVKNISEDARPVTMGEIKTLISLLVDLVNHK